MFVVSSFFMFGNPLFFFAVFRRFFTVFRRFFTIFKRFFTIFWRCFTIFSGSDRSSGCSIILSFSSRRRNWWDLKSIKIFLIIIIIIIKKQGNELIIKHSQNATILSVIMALKVVRLKVRWFRNILLVSTFWQNRKRRITTWLTKF